jgi:sigma-E factor negative regulatory protein RseC
LKQYGLVVSRRNENVVIEVTRSSACGDKCGSCGGNCEKRVIKAEVKNRLNAKIGDYIEVEVADKSILKAALIVYIMPLALLFVGIWLGYLVGNSFENTNEEIITILMGITFMIISMFFLKRIDVKIKKNSKYQFYMSRIL